MALHNLARVTSATTGTGTLTLGSAVSGFLTFADAGVTDGEAVTYAIRDGANSEIGRGVYTSSGTTLTRATIYESTNSGNAINCSGSQEVFITVPAELIPPGMIANADKYGSAGAGTSEEFETTSDPFTWSSSPAVFDSNTTVLSHYYVKTTDSTDGRTGTKAWSPAGAFDARCKLSIGCDATSGSFGASLYIANSDDTTFIVASLVGTGGSGVINVQGWTYASSSWAQRGLNQAVNRNEAYIRLTRDGSNNVSYWHSSNGILWNLIETISFTFTVAKIGIRITAPNAITQHTIVDWLRTDV